MRIQRVYQPFNNVHVNFDLDLTPSAHHHLFNVLRAKVGQEIMVFNGEGESFRAAITQLLKKQGKIKLTEKLDANPESPLNIHLAQGVSKGDRMDFVMQKATELGVNEITPVMTERTQVKLDEKRWEKKINHWQEIIIHACEQSGRSTLPKLNAPVEYTQWLTTLTPGLRLILSPHTDEKLKSVEKPERVTLLIGPEGGFSDQEVDFAINRFDFHALQLGPRVLRTETAAVAALSVLQHQWGDL